MLFGVAVFWSHRWPGGVEGGADPTVHATGFGGGGGGATGGRSEADPSQGWETFVKYILNNSGFPYGFCMVSYDFIGFLFAFWMILIDFWPY